jgi:dipeptidyl aminopeptidase/acylaminoacyl peptidase
MQPRLRRFVSSALVAALFGGGCASGVASAPPGIVPTGWRLGDEAAVRPTLAEIFLDEPPFGAPPSLVSTAADARYALIRWRDPALADESASLRLVSSTSARETRAGRSLAALLPPLGEGRRGRLVTAWSTRGHRLAVARGTSIWLMDPATERADLFASWTAADDAPDDDSDGAEDADEAEGDEEAAVVPAQDEPEQEPAPAVLALGNARVLAFREDDRALRIGDGRELVELPLAEALPGAPLGLADGVWRSRDVESPAGRLTWSDDLNVVFGADPLPRPDDAPDNQIWRVDEAREVRLEAWSADVTFERAELSPDGAYLVAFEVDDSGEPEPVEIPDYLTARVTHRKGRRQLADDRPSPVRVWVWDTSSGARTELGFGPPLSCDPPPVRAEGGDPPESEPRDLIRAVGWSRPSAGPTTLALERTSEDYRTLELWTWSAGELARRHVERDPAWIGGPARTTRWAAGGAALLFGSEVARESATPGRCQVFRLDLSSGAVRQVTHVAGEVKRFTPLEDGGLLVLASGADPAGTELLFFDPDGARGIAEAPPERYPLPPRGVASDARAARDGARAFATFETLLAPAEVVALELGAPEARIVTDTVPATYRALRLEPPVKLRTAAPDGTVVHAHVYLPPGAAPDDGGPPRAAIVFIHGAGYLQNVTDSMTRYPLNALFHARLARLGYVVVDVDYRGSAGYGGRFRGAVQYHLGGLDLADVHAAVDELVRRGLVDPRRVGCYGGSYGGFLTMMALFTAPERWAVGCALRSVTDWRTYHPGYTVPRLGRPSTHPDAYARSSPIDLVDGLSDPLLVLHGMMDSNVFAQDSIRLIEALIDRDKEFDAMLYPSQGHAFEDGEHWLDEYRRIERFLIDHLGPPLLP